MDSQPPPIDMPELPSGIDPRTIPHGWRGSEPPSPEPMEVGPRAADELRALLEFARSGEELAISRVRALLDARPEVWTQLGDLAGNTETALIKAITGCDLVVAEALARRVAALKVELAGASPTPIRRLLAERAALNWLHVHWAEAVVARALTSDTTSLRQAASAQDHLDRAQRRYLSALGTLKTVQKLVPAAKKPDTVSSAAPIPSEPQAVNSNEKVRREAKTALEIPTANVDTSGVKSSVTGPVVRLVGCEVELKPKGRVGRSRKGPRRAASRAFNPTGGDCA